MKNNENYEREQILFDKTFCSMSHHSERAEVYI